MRVIIAGGSGFIGRELTSALYKTGDEVTILSRNPDQVTGLPPGVQIIRWDGKNVMDWGKAFENSDVVVNLVGENISGEGFFPSRWNKVRKERLLSSRVDAGKVLTEAIEIVKHKPSVFIQASGIGFYGMHVDKQFSEEDASGDDFFANLCREWEASSAPVESMGIRRVVIRNGVVLSTKGKILPLLMLPYRLFVGGPIGDGKQVYSWIHINDEVNAIRFLMNNSLATGIFNLTSPNPVSEDEFGRTVAKVMKRPHYFPLPSFAMRLAFGEVASLVLEGQRVVPKRLLSLGYVFKFPTLFEALEDLI